MTQIMMGLGLAAATCAGLLCLPMPRARDAAAILLAVIAAIYIGLALGSQGRLPLRRQVFGGVCFIGLALLGLWIDWWFLVFGLMLHGAWDYLHHGRRGRGVVPPWYVPFYYALRG
jgi:hypothetical protein